MTQEAEAGESRPSKVGLVGRQVVAEAVNRNA